MFHLALFGSLAVAVALFAVNAAREDVIVIAVPAAILSGWLFSQTWQVIRARQQRRPVEKQ